jgi:hypothetical protein
VIGGAEMKILVRLLVALIGVLIYIYRKYFGF